MKEDRRRKAAGIVLLLVFVGGLGAVVLASGFNIPAFTKFNTPAIDVAAIGKQMVTYYAPVLILLGLTLAASVIGALALARREDIEQKNERVD
jgi:NADH-quinone oxidoreductase subunit J